MTKKWLMYVVTGLLCCGALAFAVTKQNTKRSMTPLEQAKAELKGVGQMTLKASQSPEIAALKAESKTQLGSQKVALQNAPSFAAMAPEGYVAPAASNVSVVKAPVVSDPSVSSVAPIKGQDPELARILGLVNQNVQLTPAQKEIFLAYRATLPVQENGNSGRNPLDDQGGPSSFGYRWVDNQAGDTATYTWEEPTTPTVLASLSDVDDNTELMTFGINFPFYAGVYTQGWVSSNGLISLSGAFVNYWETCPRWNPGDLLIYPYNDDLHTITGASSDGGQVVYQQYADHVTITWDSVGSCCTTGDDLLDFQVQLWNDGKIKYQYRQIQDMTGAGFNGSSPLIGIQQSGTADLLNYICIVGTDAPYTDAMDGRAIWFYPGDPLDHDFTCSTVLSPVGNVNINDPFTVSARFSNFGLTSESSPVSYQFNGGAIQTEATAVLAQFGTEDHAFAVQPIAPATPGLYELKIWSDLVTDEARTNDTCIVQVSVVTLGRCCYNNGAACQDLIEPDCINFFGGIWDLGMSCATDPCDNPCTLGCGPFDLGESDEAGYCDDFGATDPNGGCNVFPPSFSDIACGDTICAESFSCDLIGYRDTDWFRFTLTTTQNVTLTAESEFNQLQFGILDGINTCNVFFVASNFIFDCTQGQLSATALCLAPGDYVAFGAYGSGSGLPFGGASNTYRMWIDCTPCTLPIGRCCYNNFSTCQDLIEQNCLNLGGSWTEGLNCVDNPCENPCLLDCQPFDLTEGDETGYCDDFGASDPNGGCNNGLYQDIVCGDTVCAIAFTCDAIGYRDTDWFRFNLATTQDVTITAVSEFNNFLFGVVDINGCFFLANNFITNCELGPQSTTAFCLPPGDYAAVGLYGNFSGLPAGGNNDYRMWVDCAPCSLPIGRCCYNNFSQCQDLIETQCLNLGGLWDDALNCLDNPCENPCLLDCGANDLTEADETGYCDNNGATDPNGGCNVVPPSYQDILCGDTVCGQAFTCDATGFRDTDWFRFTVTQAANVNVSVLSEFGPVLYGIVDIADCGFAFFITNGFITDCSIGWQSVSANLVPGNYVAFVSYANFSGLPEGGNNSYRMALTGLCVAEPCDPIVDLAIFAEPTVGAPHQPVNAKLFWTAPQPEDYKVWSSTNPNNDGNPDDGADVDWTLEATLLGLAAGPQSWQAPAGFFGAGPIGGPKFYVVTAVCEPFVAPVGRCCYGEFQCTDVTESECNDLAGQWSQFQNCTNNPCPPPPATNDLCADAIEVFNGAAVAGDNTGAATDWVATCTFDDFDLWYFYVAPTTDPITVQTCEATFFFDTTLNILDACGAGVEVACNDDACNGTQSSLTFVPAAPGTYWIRLAGYNGQTGPFTLLVTQ